MGGRSSLERGDYLRGGGLNGGFYTVNVIFTLPVAPSIIFIRKENRLYKAKSTPASHSLRGLWY